MKKQVFYTNVPEVDQIEPVLPGTYTEISYGDDYKFEWSSHRFYYYDYPIINQLI